LPDHRRTDSRRARVVRRHRRNLRRRDRRPVTWQSNADPLAPTQSDARLRKGRFLQLGRGKVAGDGRPMDLFRPGLI
jgi:hypothetical protein